MYKHGQRLWKQPFLAVCLALTLCSCSASKNSQFKNAERFPQPELAKPEVTVETIEEQALSEVMKSPLDFTVMYPDAPYSWERTKLFFEKYAKPFDTSATNDQILMRSNVGRYRYEVAKASANGGFKYQVRCNPISPQSAPMVLAKRNALNLSRFIREGKLELSLLDK